MTFRFIVLTAVVAAAPGIAAADPLADGIKDYTGEYSAAYAVTKLTTFKLGKKCVAKLADKNQGMLHASSYFARDVAAWAKELTGDDWSKIGGEDHTSREANKDKVAAKIDAFKSRFGVTVSVDGDDCDASANSLWIRYWSGLATSVKNYPPPAGKMVITLNVSSKAKDVTVDVGKDGSSLTITAPKDIEASGWNDKLDRPFRKLHSGIAEDHVFNVKESTGRFSSAWVLTKLSTLKLGKKCLAKIANKDSEFAHTAGFYTRDILEYVKAVGGDDWDRIEQQSANDPKTNRELVAKGMDEFGKRLKITLTVEGDDCDAGSNAYWMKYWSAVAKVLKDYPPKSNKVTIAITITPKAKDLAVTGNKDGSTWTITAPKDGEKPQWTDKLDAAFKKTKR